ncbi:uncharacterized protein LOC143030638 [Oratosquilla oratoria]|uniref:uncharacterized protein LOC143030638 n=1 Tax=Oratosquilla oratoria TaxID=337810 RepID=UPI003F7596EB
MQRTSHGPSSASYLLLLLFFLLCAKAEEVGGSHDGGGGGEEGGGGGGRERKSSLEWKLHQNIRNFNYEALHGRPIVNEEEEVVEGRRRRIPLPHQSQPDEAGDLRQDQHDQTDLDHGDGDRSVIDGGVIDRPVIDHEGHDRFVVDHEGDDQRPVIDHEGDDKPVIDQEGYDRPVIDHLNTWRDNWLAAMLLAGEEPKGRREEGEDDQGREKFLRQSNFGLLNACEDAMCDQILRQAHGLSRMKKIRSFVRDSLTHVDMMVTSMEGELIQTGKELSRYLGSACRSAQLVLQGVIKNTVDVDREPNIPRGNYARVQANQETNFLQYIHAINNAN